MMSSRAKNFRCRTADTDPNSEETKPSPKPQPSSNKPKPPKPAETRTRLSFADEEEEDIDDAPKLTRRPVNPKPVSSNSTHRLSSSKDRPKAKGLSYSSSSSLPSNLQSQAGEYTKEKLLELQKNARPLGSMPKPPPKPTLVSGLDPKPMKPNKPSEPVIILKGLVKPPMSMSMTPSSTKDEDEEEQEEEEEEEDNKFPDQATINAIKAKRQQLLQPRHAAPDFVSLDGGGVISSRRDTGGSSDDDEHDTELDGRIGFINKGANKGVFEAPTDDINTSNNNNIKVISMNNEKFMDLGLHEAKQVDEEEEEERMWEDEQVRKGLGQVYRFDDSSSVPAPPQQPSVFTSRSAEVMSFAQQAEVAIRSVQENITKLTQTHKSSLNSLVRTEAFLSEALLEISSLEKSMEIDDKKYVYMQQLKEYVSVLCDFLNHKACYIEELEEQMQKLHEGRASAVSDRRADDLSDESSEMEGAVRAAMNVLEGARSNSDISILSAREAARAAKEGSTSSLYETKLDEFGRDMNLKRRMELKSRGEAKKKRKMNNESKRTAFNDKSGVNSIEGELSTDESETDNNAYKSSREQILAIANSVFSDASEEYANLKHVKDRFQRWRDRYGDAYRDSYASLRVPAIFSPYVRLELLKWDPLYDTTDFVNMDWHNELFDYGQQNPNSDPNSEDAEEDSDSNPIPELVEKIALPILHHEIEHCWDVLSTQKTKNAVFAANMVMNYLSLSSKALHELLAMVAVRLTEAVNALDVPLWGSNVIKAVPGAGELCAYRFGMSVRLLRNIFLWKDILAGPVIEKMALDELLRAKMLPHVKCMGLDLHDAVLRAERVVDCVSGLVSSSRSEKVRPLVEFVKELGAKLEKRQKLGVDDVAQIHGLARRLKKMMVALNDYDAARAILKAFQLKEAL